MASSSALGCCLLLIAVFLTAVAAQYAPMTLTVVNNCPFPVWPAIQPDSGLPGLEYGGFFLPALSHRSFPAPTTPWSGRIWARTSCSPTGADQLKCATGDCSGRLHCNGLGGAAPATLAQVSLHHGGPNRDMTSYSVSVVDGFNIGLSITPHEGRGNCPVLGCRQDLNPTCPSELQYRSPASGSAVVGCKSGCEAFGTDELCCRNHYNSVQACRPSDYSGYFKRACPQAYTYAHDSPSLTHECSAPRELKVIFCH